MPEEFGGSHVWEDLGERTRISLSKSSCDLNSVFEFDLSKIVSKRISHSQVIKVKLGVSRSLGSHGGFPLAGHVTTEPERPWFPCVQPPWLSLSCVCLCFPSSEPGVFPLSIFSPGTLDYPGIQSWREVSGAVWCLPGFALRSVNFWK